MVRVNVGFAAAIPVGHHVTVLPLEMRSLFSGDYSPSKAFILCDDDTRVVYTARGVGSESMTYESIHFDPDSPFRISASVPPLRGRVVSCLVRQDSGDSVYNETILGVEPDR
jgi:hypothetical protein